MATRTERVDAIIGALRGGRTKWSDAKRDAILDDFASQDTWRQGWAAAQGVEPVPAVADMTGPQKRHLYLWVLRRFHLEVAQGARASKAAEEARQAAIATAKRDADLEG